MKAAGRTKSSAAPARGGARRTFFVAAGLLAAVFSQATAAADVRAGKGKAAAACAVCHGPLGISSLPDAPSLAGQPALYLAAQLRAYRGGQRKHEVMGVVAQTLGDADIENLAAWYASIRIEAQEPR